MKKIVIFLIGLFLCSCGFYTPKKQYIERTVYLKCQIPEIPKAELKEIPSNATPSVKLQIILNNYIELKRENELLRDAINTCK